MTAEPIQQRRLSRFDEILRLEIASCFDDSARNCERAITVEQFEEARSITQIALVQNRYSVAERQAVILWAPRSLTRRYSLDSEGLQRVCGKTCGYAKAMVDLIAGECSPCVRAEEPIHHAVVVS